MRPRRCGCGRRRGGPGSPCAFRDRDQLGHALGGRHPPAGQVVAVFEDHQRGRRPVARRRLDGRLDLVRSEDPVGVVDRPRQGSGQGRHRAHFEVEDVGAGFGHDLGAGVGVDVNRDLVAHGAGRNKDRGFAAEELGGPFLEAVDRGIFAVDIVADVGRGHRPSHGVCGLCYRVRSKVDGCMSHRGILPRLINLTSDRCEVRIRSHE